MWIRLPKGTSNISLNQQNFVSEARAKSGKETYDYVRIPDHFWPTLQMVGGYVVEDPAGVNEDDLPPPPGGKRDEALSALALQLQSTQEELRTATEELGVMKGQVAAAESATAEANLARDNAQNQLDNLLKELDNKGYDPANIPMAPKDPPGQPA